MSDTTNTKKAAPKKEYRVVSGLSFGKDGRNEPGEKYTGPKESIEWLLEQGHIEEA